MSGNLHTELRKMALEHIDKTENLPDFVKPLAKQYVIAHLNIIGTYLGTIELTWRRSIRVGPTNNEESSHADM